MKSMILFSTIVLGGMIAGAQEMSMIRTSGEIEASCRIKAKEIAAETYRGCVTDQKNSQIEQIKKEYAAKLQALKAHYEQELKKMSGSKAKVDEPAVEAAPIPAPAEKSEKTDSVSNKPVGKKLKQASGSSSASPKKIAKKSPAAPAPVAKSEVSSTEMTVQLKAAPGTPSGDESTMDLPEPIPVDDIPSSESSI